MDRYSNIPILKTSEGVRYYQNIVYPEIPFHEDDTYIITDVTERADSLALDFYGDESYYWIIICANPNKLDFGSIYIGSDEQIRIPYDLNEILEKFTELND